MGLEILEFKEVWYLMRGSGISDEVRFLEEEIEILDAKVFSFLGQLIFNEHATIAVQQ